MRIKDFINEMTLEWFPNEYGPWVNFNCFDPLFTLSELRIMEKSGIIELDKTRKRFRLTMKATKILWENYDNKEGLL